MSDIKEIKLSDYMKNASAMGESLYEPSSTLVSLEKYNNMIFGNIPMKIDTDEENFEIIDFPEIAPRIDAVSRNFFHSVLITGNSGCGKRTLEKYFRWKFFDYYSFGQNLGPEEKENINRFICYYEINTYDFLMYSNEKCCEMINSLFRQIKEVCMENIGKIIYISFGDVTDILKNKKISKIFTRCIKMLAGIPQNICIITCVYDGEASELKEKIKSPFIIENLDLPDENARSDFFYSFITNHENFVFKEINENDESSKNDFIKNLCEITEEFNFRMLNRLTEGISMELKGQALFNISLEDDEIKDEKYQEFIGIIENEFSEKYNISLSKIKEIAEKIKRNTYIPPQKSTMPFVINTPVESKISDKEENKSETNAEEKLFKANTIAELDSRNNFKKRDRVILLGKGIAEPQEESEEDKILFELLDKKNSSQEKISLDTAEN